MRERSRRGAAALALGALLLLAGCGGLHQQEPSQQPASAEQAQPQPAEQQGSPTGAGPLKELKPLPGYPAANIKGVDVATGESISLLDLRGQVVLINFWATWCPPCKAEMPDMEEFQAEMGEKVRVIGVGADPRESPEKMAEFAKAMGLTFTILHDKAAAAGTYRAGAIPTSLFIDKEGVIRVRHSGPMTLEMMKEFYSETEKASESK